MKRVLIIGGYGNFGSYIARSLAGEASIRLLIGGRSLEKARNFVSQLHAVNDPEAVALDIFSGLPEKFALIKPDIVIHTTGPFQRQGYIVAEACLKQECHYLDLADARHFVVGIDRYDGDAKSKNLLIISGASSVPCLTAAVIDHYAPHFSSLAAIDYGISAAQQTNRGLATTSAILSYVGKSFTTLREGRFVPVYGWQNIHAEKYPQLGWRLFGNCDIPDLDIFPKRYAGLKTQHFAAGHGVAVLHIGLWLLSWLVRLKIIASLETIAEPLLKLSFLFDAFGNDRSGFHMFLSGADKKGQPKTVRFYIIARSGHGPNIPCMPVIIIARRLAQNLPYTAGARPCIDMIDLDTYCDALKGLDISVIRDGAHD